MAAAQSPARGPRRRGRWTAEDIRRDLLCYAVTDRTWADGRTLPGMVRQALDGGATFMQLREKNLGHEEIVRVARQLAPLCAARDVPLVIDDDVEAAREAGVDGVHVGQSDMACERARAILGDDAIVGVSCQTVEQAVRAWNAGADYLGVGAMHPTATKPEAADVSWDELRHICSATPLPVVAIGGIDATNVRELRGTGVAGAAVVSAIFAAEDVAKATRELVESLRLQRGAFGAASLNGTGDGFLRGESIR
ncbi:MAG: thiamine phosphate synthase [Atopobiaceae bacterium]